MLEEHNIKTIKHLADLLKKYQINYSLWESNKTKNIKTLFKELTHKESILKIENKNLIRKIKVVRAHVFYFDNKQKQYFHLKELKQVYTTGTIKKRNLPFSINEKLKINESLLNGLKRALKEEINILKAKSIIKMIPFKEKQFSMSSSFPGLLTEYNYRNFIVTIYKKDKKNLYKEIQKEKTTFFAWQKVKLNEMMLKIVNQL